MSTVCRLFSNAFWWMKIFYIFIQLTRSYYSLYWLFHVELHHHFYPLQWCHNGRKSISNHQTHDCLLNRSFRHRSKKTSQLRVTGLCVGNSPVTGEIPTQRASNVENVSIWWCHHIYPCHCFPSHYKSFMIVCQLDTMESDSWLVFIYSQQYTHIIAWVFSLLPLVNSGQKILSCPALCVCLSICLLLYLAIVIALATTFHKSCWVKPLTLPGA